MSPGSASSARISLAARLGNCARGAEFLPLKQHRNARHQQEISGHRAKAARARQRVTALSGSGIGDLVVVLQKDDKAFRREVEGRRAARVPLPLVALALIEETVLGGGNELARPTAVIRVVGFVMPGQRYHGAVMEVVVPQGVEPVTAALGRTRQLGVLRLVLSNDKGGSAARRRSHLPRDGGDNMIFRSIENC